MKLTPRAIREVYNSSAPYQREDIMKHYVGQKILWDLNFYSVSRLQKNELRIHLISNGGDIGYSQVISLTIKEDAFPSIKLLSQYSLVRVIGEIEEVNAISINLKNAQLQEVKNEDGQICSPLSSDGEVIDLSKCKIPSFKNVNSNEENKEDEKIVSGEKRIHESKKNWYRKPENIIGVMSIILAIAGLFYEVSKVNNVHNGNGDIVSGNKNISQVNNGGGDNVVSDTIIYENKLKLRSLDPMETGKKFTDMPSNTYFFADAIEISYYLKTPSIPFTVSGNKRDNNYFEIQKISNDSVILGYVNSENYSKVGEIDGKKTVPMALFPTSWGEYTKLVGVPMGSVLKIDSRRIELNSTSTLLILDLESKNVLSNVDLF